MIEQDYLLRVIQDFGKLMRAILNKKTPASEIEGEFESISNQWMGLPSRMLLSLPASAISTPTAPLAWVTHLDTASKQLNEIDLYPIKLST